MPPSNGRKVFIRRVNSNGEDVAPSVCASYYKAPQRQADNSGGYVLDYYYVNENEYSHPVDSLHEDVVQLEPSEEQGQ